MRLIGIVGSREYKAMGVVAKFVRTLPDDWSVMVVSGGASGVDSWAENTAKQLDIPTARLPYRRRFGKSGGMIRNSALVEFCDEIYAFWDMASPGTLDTISKAKNSGKLRKVYGPNGLEIEV